MKMKIRRFASLLLVALILVGCSSFGTLGVVTKSSSDPGSLLRSGRAYEEIGPVEGRACRYFLVAIIPWGDSTFSTAVEKALAKRGGDALLNVSMSSSLYTFIPIYNVFSFTCTTVRGIAIKFQ